MGYHKRAISPQGKYGESSKIFEEVDEFRESLEQKNPVLALVELSDLIGAIEGWLDKNHPDIHLEHLVKMARATRLAFMDGTRKPR